jgi:excisionase family DNA binding protein
MLFSDEALEAIAARAADLVLARMAGERAQRSASRYLTVAEAAAYLRCKPQRVYDLRSSGRLSGVKDGSRVLIAADDLHAHLVGPG